MNHVNKNLLEKIRELSIIDSALHLGIKVIRNKAYCFRGHDTKSASLNFSKAKGVFNCFGCGVKGDSIELVKLNLNKNFYGACMWLAAEFNLDNPMFTATRKLAKKNPVKPVVAVQKEQREEQPNPVIYEWIIAHTTLSEKARSYLTKERGFSQSVIDDLQIKDVEQPDVLFRNLAKEFGQKALIGCGLLKVNDKNEVKPVWWDHVILFPFTNLNYRVDYLQARRYGKGEPKYVNLSGVKSSIYNLDKIAGYIQGDDIVFCEGVPDTIAAMEFKMKAVGILGANAFKDEWIEIFRDFSITIIPDNDNGGRIFAEKIRGHFEKIGKDVRTLRLPNQVKDLNEHLNSRNNRT